MICAFVLYWSMASWSLRERGASRSARIARAVPWRGPTYEKNNLERGCALGLPLVDQDRRGPRVFDVRILPEHVLDFAARLAHRHVHVEKCQNGWHLCINQR